MRHLGIICVPMCTELGGVTVSARTSAGAVPIRVESQVVNARRLARRSPSPSPDDRMLARRSGASTNQAILRPARR